MSQTQLQRARDGEVTPAMERIAEREDVREGLAAYRIAAHAADVANDRDDARDWDDALSEARYAFDCSEQFELALDPERAKAYHDQTLPGDNYKEARFCSMCGVEFCSMRIDQDARESEGDGMESIADETDVADSAAAEVNRPPVGTHDSDAELHHHEARPTASGDD